MAGDPLRHHRLHLITTAVHRRHPIPTIPATTVVDRGFSLDEDTEKEVLATKTKVSDTLLATC